MGYDILRSVGSLDCRWFYSVTAARKVTFKIKIHINIKEFFAYENRKHKQTEN